MMGMLPKSSSFAGRAVLTVIVLGMLEKSYEKLGGEMIWESSSSSYVSDAGLLTAG